MTDTVNATCHACRKAIPTTDDGTPCGDCGDAFCHECYPAHEEAEEAWSERVARPCSQCRQPLDTHTDAACFDVVTTERDRYKLALAEIAASGDHSERCARGRCAPCLAADAMEGK